jgi:hypothetical protein
VVLVALGATAGQKFVANLDKHSKVKTAGNGKWRSRVMYPETEKESAVD